MAESRVPLGSGYVYIMAWRDEYATAFPERSVIETEENKMGGIKEGATLTISNNKYADNDDMQEIFIDKITATSVEFKATIIKINADVINKLMSNVEAEYDSESGRTKVSGYGPEKDNGKYYIVRFVQPDEVEGDLITTIVGKSSGAFETAFNNGAVSKIPVEFKACKRFDGNKLWDMEF